MQYSHICLNIRRCFTLNGVSPRIWHPTKGAHAGIYHYRKHDPQTGQYEPTWTSLGTWEEMMIALGFPGTPRPIGNEWRLDFHGFPSRYYANLSLAIAGYRTHRGELMDAVIIDRRTNEIEYPLSKKGQKDGQELI